MMVKKLYVLARLNEKGDLSEFIRGTGNGRGYGVKAYDNLGDARKALHYFDDAVIIQYRTSRLVEKSGE